MLLPRWSQGSDPLASRRPPPLLGALHPCPTVLTTQFPHFCNEADFVALGPGAKSWPFPLCPTRPPPPLWAHTGPDPAVLSSQTQPSSWLLSPLRLFLWVWAPRARKASGQGARGGACQGPAGCCGGRRCSTRPTIPGTGRPSPNFPLQPCVQREPGAPSQALVQSQLCHFLSVPGMELLWASAASSENGAHCSRLAEGQGNKGSQCWTPCPTAAGCLPSCSLVSPPGLVQCLARGRGLPIFVQYLWPPCSLSLASYEVCVCVCVGGCVGVCGGVFGLPSVFPSQRSHREKRRGAGKGE